MQVEFQVKVIKGKIEVKEEETFKPIQLEDAEILWDIDANNKKIEGISIVFKGVDITKDSSDNILPTNRDLDEKAFKIATYISNKIFLNTGIDALEPESILCKSPNIFSENQEEKDILEKCKKQGFTSIKGVFTVVKPFEF